MDSVYSGKLIKSDITAEMLRELSKRGEGGGLGPNIPIFVSSE